MEKRTHEQEVERDAGILYEAIMSGLSYTTAVIRTNVFDNAPLEHTEAVLRQTITRLQLTSASQKSEGIQNAQEGIRGAIINIAHFDSAERQRQLRQQAESRSAKEAGTISSQYRLTREAPVHYFTSIDGTTAQVTGVSKALDDQLPEGK